MTIRIKHYLLVVIGWIGVMACVACTAAVDDGAELSALRRNSG